MKLTTVYILKLINNKYYVGRSSNVAKRFNDHLNGTGSFWTKKYKPINIEKVVENVSLFEEDKVTKEYMYKYGIDNVRGGSYVRERLAPYELKLIRKEIFAAHDLCIRCGSNKHFIKDCDSKRDIYGNYIGSISGNTTYNFID